ncbi:MAG: hypothetical protein Q8P30_01780 [Candidatus Uhrbacteria bacterium]|nr:hypothetical protein [Candidatus Uhrbacteria bacterium]
MRFEDGMWYAFPVDSIPYWGTQDEEIGEIDKPQRFVRFSRGVQLTTKQLQKMERSERVSRQALDIAICKFRLLWGYTPLCCMRCSDPWFEDRVAIDDLPVYQCLLDWIRQRVVKIEQAR